MNNAVISWSKDLCLSCNNYGTPVMSGTFNVEIIDCSTQLSSYCSSSNAGLNKINIGTPVTQKIINIDGTTQPSRTIYALYETRNRCCTTITYEWAQDSITNPGVAVTGMVTPPTVGTTTS